MLNDILLQGSKLSVNSVGIKFIPQNTISFDEEGIYSIILELELSTPMSGSITSTNISIQAYNGNVIKPDSSILTFDVNTNLFSHVTYIDILNIKAGESINFKSINAGAILTNIIQGSSRLCITRLR